jgi:outer membrane protein assembly factor BamB
MTRPAFAVGCAAAAVLLSAIACGTTKGAVPAAAGTPSAGARSAFAPDAGACPTRRAWATKITSAGHVAWQVSLPTAAQQQGVVLQPLVIAGVAVFAEENAVYGIRVSDGRQLWRRAFSTDIAAESGAVYGLWPSGGRIVVLTGQVSASARLTALTASTGAVRWTLPLPSELLGSQAQASGGTLAVLRPDGVLESVDLASGRVLWSHRVGQSLGPAAIGSVIAAGSDGRVSGYDGRTGRVLWTASGLPEQPDVTAVDGVFLAYDNTDTGGVVALNPRTGRVEWRFGSDAVLGAGPAGIAFATYTPRRVYLVNPATGRARWSVATFAVSSGDNPGQLLEAGSDVVLPEGSVAPSADVFRLVVRDAADGRVLWSTKLAGGADGLNLALLPLAGGQAIAVTSVQGTGFPTSTRLTVRRLGAGRQLASVTLPDMILAPLTVTGTSVLAQSDSPACATPAIGTAVAPKR